MKEKIEYKGYTIVVEQDLDARMPWEYMDGNPPFYSKGRRRIDKTYAPGMLDIINMIPRSKWRELAGIVYADVNLFLQDVRHYGFSSWEEQRDIISDSLNSEDIDTLETLCDLAELKYYSTTSRGCSQSDWRDLLMIATPEWIEETGIAEKDIEDALKSAAKLWGDWAWGDVYGYVIHLKDGAAVDSCWGFYGGDHEESGLLECARNHIDWEIKNTQKQIMKEITPHTNQFKS